MVRRVLVKGGSGAGKTTLANQLAQRLGVPHIELDALHHGPSWTAATAAELQGRVHAALDDAFGWVVDGNYGTKLGNLVVERAELIVWLDLPLHVRLARLVRRTSRRWLLREELWNGNRENLLTAFCGADALFPYTVRTHFRNRRRWPMQLAGRPVVRLRSQAEVSRWLERFYAEHAPLTAADKACSPSP